VEVHFLAVRDPNAALFGLPNEGDETALLSGVNRWPDGNHPKRETGAPEVLLQETAFGQVPAQYVRVHQSLGGSQHFVLGGIGQGGPQEEGAVLRRCKSWESLRRHVLGAAEANLDAMLARRLPRSFSSLLPPCVVLSSLRVITGF